MICIRPIAPLGDTARTWPPLSTCIAARIHSTGTWNRCDASAMKAERERVGGELYSVRVVS
jgi:hypothetical protein